MAASRPGPAPEPSSPPQRVAARIDVVGRVPAGVREVEVVAVLRRALAALGKERVQLVIRFASDGTLRAYNRRFRGVDRATDVLSFPDGDAHRGVTWLGDLLVSRERAQVQARRSGLSLEREVLELVLHGLLHLLGHDHETDHGEMDALELELRERVLDGRAPDRRRRTSAVRRRVVLEPRTARADPGFR